MKQAYSVFNSKLLVTNIKQRTRKPKMFWLYKILYCILIIAILAFTFFTFYAVLDSEEGLFNIVSLGAVFATLGSTLVSVASLLCSRYYEEFHNCMDTLQHELLTQNIDLSWPFLKSREIFRTSEDEYMMYQILNPKVCFEIGAINLSIEIPAQKKDFYEPELLKNILRMKICKKTYIAYLINHSESIMESGLYIWECMYHIQCSAFLYKICRNFIVAGTVFFISGLIATFLYPIIC